MKGGEWIDGRYVLGVGLTDDTQDDLLRVTIEPVGWEGVDYVMLRLAREAINEELEVLRLREQLDGEPL